MASLYELSAPLLIKHIITIKSLLEIGDAYFTKNGKPENYITSLRLYLDMFPVSGQVNVFSFIARQAVVRLLTTPSNPDPASSIGMDTARSDCYAKRTLAELYALLDETLGFLQLVKEEEVNKKDLSISTPRVVPGFKFEFTDLQDLMNFQLPNCFFHTTMIYGILRANGVPLEKANFMFKFMGM